MVKMCNKERLFNKVKFQMWKKNIDKGWDDKLYIVLDDELKKTFLSDAERIKEEVGFISYSIERDEADREVLVLDLE